MGPGLDQFQWRGAKLEAVHMENSFKFCFKDEQRNETVAARGSGVKKRQEKYICVLIGTYLRRMEIDV